MFGCFVDRRMGDNCVMDLLDGDTIENCDIAVSLHSSGKLKTECPHWKEKPPAICECCGQVRVNG